MRQPTPRSSLSASDLKARPRLKRVGHAEVTGSLPRHGASVHPARTAHQPSPADVMRRRRPRVDYISLLLVGLVLSVLYVFIL